MNHSEAEQIKTWRCGTDGSACCSWRTIAKKASELWPEKDICSGNQIFGMKLCEEASAILGEDIDK